MGPAALQVDRLRSTLVTRRGFSPHAVGRRIEYFYSVASTNDEAWSRIHDVDADGLVILAEHQTTGRGRMGRSWTSPRGASLLCSVVLIDEAGSLGPGDVALLPPVAALDAIRECTGLTAVIKWPNDLTIRGRKVAGILVESRPCIAPARCPPPLKRWATQPPRSGLPGERRAYVIGIGINCLQQPGHFPAELAETATSLEIECPHAIDRTDLARELIQQLDRWLGYREGWTSSDLRQEWLRRAEPPGGRVLLRYDGREYSGWVHDVDPSAALLVLSDDGVIRVFPAQGTTIVKGPATPDTISSEGRAGSIPSAAILQGQTSEGFGATTAGGRVDVSTTSTAIKK